jgi:hypothetical protein
VPIPAGPSNSLDILTLHEGYTAIQDKTSAAAGSGSNDERCSSGSPPCRRVSTRSAGQS